MAIVTRAGKGTALSHTEMDNNFIELDTNPNGIKLPKTQNTGIKVDISSPTFAWHDIIGYVHTHGGTNAAQNAVYRGGIRAIQCAEGKEAFVDFHIPHDYVMGTEIFIHVHWSHASPDVIGGSVTWGCEMMYAKGHNQGIFQEPVIVSFLQNASTIQYQHMVAETSASVNGGSATQLNTSMLEPDGIIQCRVFLDSNDIISSSTIPDPFIHFIGVHYQSTAVGTKQKTPDFWT